MRLTDCVCRYEIHFAQQKVVTPSVLMEKLIADSRSGTVVSVGTVIDATGGDAFLYDTKYVSCRLSVSIALYGSRGSPWRR